MAIQYKIVGNPLTTPHSHSIRFIARNSASREDIAADIALRHPNFSKSDILSLLNTEDEVIALRLLNGEQVTKEGSCTWFPSFSGRLENPDDPIPPLDECLQINISVSQPFVERIRQDAQTERIATTDKLPVVTSAEDQVLGLKDVLRADGMLRITGSDLFFDRKDGIGQCLIEGTHNGRAVQTRLGTITNAEITMMPDVPSQAQPWQNEYRLSITTRYTENGTPRTGIYKQMLRTPLAVRIGDNAGILSSSGSAPLVTVSGGTLAEDETRLRIQVLYNAPDEELRFSLLDMEEGGQKGDEVRAAANGTYTLLGWPDCDVTSLEVTVASYNKLLALVKNPYGNRLVDILDVSMGN
uniref:hypothetical protein n=1 Tax=Candidatus Electronema sp. TaxID=2698783 RepID=UPI0040577C42